MPDQQPKQPYIGSWKWRRAVIFITLGFCFWVLWYLLVELGDKISAAWATFAVSIVGLIAAIVGSYCFAAAWDDHNIRKTWNDVTPWGGGSS